MREALPSFARQADLADAEAIDMDRGRFAPATKPTPEEVSETRRRLRRERGEDSQSGSGRKP